MRCVFASLDPGAKAPSVIDCLQVYWFVIRKGRTATRVPAKASHMSALGIWVYGMRGHRAAWAWMYEMAGEGV